MSEPASRPHERDWRKLPLLLVGVAFIAVACALLWWAEGRPESGALTGVPVSFSADPILEISQMTRQSVKSNLVGRWAILDRAPVLEVLGDYAFWLGTSMTDRVLVILLGEITGRQAEERVEVRKGQSLFLHGLVMPVSTPERIDNLKYLTDTERRAIQRESIYISALRVVIIEDGAQTH